MGGKLERHPVTGQVVTLNLAHTQVDNNDLEHVAQLFQPLMVDLTDTDITDKAAAHLAGWTSLRVLKLGGTRITRKAVDEIKKYSPGLVVQ